MAAMTAVAWLGPPGPGKSKTNQSILRELLCSTQDGFPDQIKVNQCESALLLLPPAPHNHLKLFINTPLGFCLNSYLQL